MSKVAIIYDSKSGHTKMMAEAVAEGAKSAGAKELRILHVDEASAQDLLWADGIAIGSPCYCGLISGKLKAFLDNSLEAWGKVEGKVACAFASEGGAGGGAELTLLSILIGMMNYGFLVFGVTDYVAKKMTLHYGVVAVSEPNEEELAACHKLGEKLVGHVMRMKPSA